MKLLNLIELSHLGICWADSAIFLRVACGKAFAARPAGPRGPPLGAALPAGASSPVGPRGLRPEWARPSARLRGWGEGGARRSGQSWPQGAHGLPPLWAPKTLAMGLGRRRTDAPRWGRGRASRLHPQPEAAWTLGHLLKGFFFPG